ncbi:MULTISPECIES: universal stress protein [unclassified Modestobacter]|uniref:universal stress protein n=1 Tax=unclassified Modestobacter TaxID=2643866 RepID=UPI0022A9FAF3|nr:MULTISPECIES: universal stress protein [unclassified Modestobacter]MCZ2812077.1 universal stress protein [Modestobacter sp. VKM Ac-2979]MCZ2843801.1 universal stress protein [Modestobacter sp. VKM Ac-2980]MCZ2849753.1 universal stress protein [Modestobacter sp. VKM Ac-2978]
MGLTSRFRPIVVGVDGSGASAAAVGAAAEEASRRLLPLRLVRALPGPLTTTPDRRVQQSVQSGPGTAAAAELSALRRTLAHHLPGGQIGTAVVMGPPVRVLLREAAAAELLVLGVSGADHHGPHVGAVTAAVAQRSPCPVLVVHPGPPVPAAAPVVVLVAGGARVRRLLSAAVLEASTRSTGLDVVPTSHAESGPPPDLTVQLRDLARTYPAVAVHLRDPVLPDPTAVMEMAHGAGLLVVGREDQEGHPGPPALRAVLAAAPTPVLIVPLTPAAVPEPIRALHVPVGPS